MQHSGVFTLTGVRIVDPNQRTYYKGVPADTNRADLKPDLLASLTKDGSLDSVVHDKLANNTVNIVVRGGTVEHIGDISVGLRVDCAGMYASPGLVDIATNTDIPGTPGVNGLKRALISGAAGGYTCISPMSTKKQPIQTLSQVTDIFDTADYLNKGDINPIAALTVDHAGETMVDIGALYRYGIESFSDGAHSAITTRALRLCMQYASTWPVRIISSSQDYALTDGAVVTHCGFSETLGLPTQPKEAEVIGITRDLAIAHGLGMAIHFQNVTTRGGIEVIKHAKSLGMNVTCDVSPYHAIFTVQDSHPYRVPATFYPPLRERDDVEAVQQALQDGTIDAIASHHQAVNPSMRQFEYVLIPKGLPTLEHTLPLVLTHLVDVNARPNDVGNGVISLVQAIHLLSRKPAQLRGIDNHGEAIEVGAHANMVIYDPNATYTVDAPPNQVDGGNPLLHGKTLRGVIANTLAYGSFTYYSNEVEEETHGN